jgi:iron complex outermembrane receptor protein
VYGVDAAAILQVTERLNLYAAVVWLPKQEYLDYIVNQGGDDLSGYELPRAPEWSAIASLTYRWPLANHGELSGRIEYSYRSAFFYTLSNLATESQPAYGLLNLYLRFEPERANWYAFASGRNLTDEDYYHQAFIQAAPGYPDTYEVGVGFRF